MELATKRTDPVESVDPRFTRLKVAPCETLHGPAGYAAHPRVHRYSVDRMDVRLYPPGPNRVYSSEEGAWLRPLEIIDHAGADAKRPLCIHRNHFIGNYWVYQERA